MTPRPDGSHDSLPADYHQQSKPKVAELAAEVVNPLFDLLVKELGEDGATAWLVTTAEKMEPKLRVTHPEHELLAWLDDYRAKQQRGFE